MSNNQEQNKNIKKFKLENMSVVEPLTDNQKLVKKYYEHNHLVLLGSAGTGKTFLSIALALEDVLTKETPYDKVIIVRSCVPTKNIGFMPGTEEEKNEVYLAPYKGICSEIFNLKGAWEKLEANSQIEFKNTSYIRGITIDNSIVIVDEAQNLTFHELDGIITRVGKNTKIIFSGDTVQSDLLKAGDKEGLPKFLKIINKLNNVKIIKFDWTDIVRSDFVRDYIMTKEMMELNGYDDKC